MAERPDRTEVTPVAFLERSAGLVPEHTAVVHGERRHTYAALAGRANRLASALRGRGLQHQDRVAVLCPNSPAILEAHYGVPAAGGVLVPINIRLHAREVADIVAASRPRLVLVDRELRESLSETGLDGIEVVEVHDTGADDDPYERLLADGSPEPVESWLADEEEPLSINYTSGTTGTPKGAVVTHRGAYLMALGLALECGLRGDSTYLWTLPMFHCNGWCFPWAVTAVAATHVCLRKVEPGRIWELFEAERVTHFCGAPTVHIGIVNDPAAHRLEQAVNVPTGGAPPTPTLLARMEELNLHPRHLYGLTECYGPHTSCTWDPAWDELSDDEQARIAARQGQAFLAGERVRVVDDDMADVPRDAETLGEVVLRGNTVMSGYHEAPEETEEAFRGGWFHTGDLAVMHPDGHIELRDRAKDIVISGGENISTIEIEQVLSRHPAVLEVAVVATPDERWGERPKAFVELRSGEEAGEEELIDFASEHLARFKRPAAVKFGELPRTSTGKIQKHVLRERERSGQTPHQDRAIST
jgi:fatty-acyl-CoA synthase